MITQLLRAKVRTLSIATALLLSMALSLPAYAGDTKVPFFLNPSGSCSIGATGGTPTRSFAAIEFSDNRVKAEAHIQHGIPKTTYHVVLVQIPGDGDCSGVQAVLATDDHGEGGVNLSDAVQPGTTGAFVLTDVLTVGDFEATKAVPRH